MTGTVSQAASHSRPRNCIRSRVEHIHHVLLECFLSASGWRLPLVVLLDQGGLGRLLWSPLTSPRRISRHHLMSSHRSSCESSCDIDGAIKRFFRKFDFVSCVRPFIKLVDQQLLLFLLVGEHVGIRFGCHLDEFLVPNHISVVT